MPRDGDLTYEQKRGIALYHLKRQSNDDQKDYSKCLFGALHRDGIVKAKDSYTESMMKALGVSEFDACVLQSAASVEHKRQILLSYEHKRHSIVDRLKGLMGILR